MEDLKAELEWLWLEFESLSESVEHDRCTNKEEIEEMKADRFRAALAIGAAIKLITPNA